MEFLAAIGKICLYWLFFYGCYVLLLRRLTYFHWNRGYLLGALVLSLALPFIKVPDAAPVVEFYSTQQLDSLVVAARPDAFATISWIDLVILAYLAGVGYRVFCFMQRMKVLRRLWADSEEVVLDEATLYLLPDDRIGSFSFLSRIGISKSDYARHFDKILSHEMVHVRQRHTLDIILIELLQALFWFYPLLNAYRKAIQEVHEFLADQEIADRDGYAEFLVEYALGSPRLRIVNGFYSASMLRQRIEMLYKAKSSGWNTGLYVIAGFFSLLFVVLVASCSRNGDPLALESQKPAELERPADMGPVFTAVEQAPAFPGGTKALFEFLGSGIRYPEAALKAQVSGKVFLQFVVASTGVITDVQVLKGIGFGCDEEAMRVVKAMPRWEPGLQSGVPVNVKYTLPVNFQLLAQVVVTERKEEEPIREVRFSPPVVVKDDPSPLFVVDGQEMPSVNLNPGDIQSINVLKGEQASTRYGDKAVHGVIEITSKKKN